MDWRWPSSLTRSRSSSRRLRRRADLDQPAALGAKPKRCRWRCYSVSRPCILSGTSRSIFRRFSSPSLSPQCVANGVTRCLVGRVIAETDFALSWHETGEIVAECFAEIFRMLLDVLPASIILLCLLSPTLGLCTASMVGLIANHRHCDLWLLRRRSRRVLMRWLRSRRVLMRWLIRTHGSDDEN